MNYRRIASLKTAEDFLAYAGKLGVTLPFDHEMVVGTGEFLDEPFFLGEQKIGNRFSILPMEGWDAETGGSPSELTLRRWQRFGDSGAKLIWGGEAVAVEHAGRANPNQLWLHDKNVSSFVTLREELLAAHQKAMGTTDDLLVGLQLTHSGRFARPNTKSVLEPQVLYRHPLLEKNDDEPYLLTDEDLQRIVRSFVHSAALAAEAGFQFVDVKHCHGYLGHETLSSFDRPGKYGGSFENRTRFLREIVAGIRERVPGMTIGVRLSAVDWVPFRPGDQGVGRPCEFDGDTYRYAFGGDGSGLGIDLAEPLRLLDLFKQLDIRLVCISVGSPYYNPHFQRPAIFPPSDGYQPPEDPLIGVARQIDLVQQLKRERPELIYVGSGYSYLQEWLPHVAQAAVREGAVDFVGLGRMVLSYPEMPADVLAGRPLGMKKICRTFSDCTTAPRKGLVSGCFPLDDYYKQMPEHKDLKAYKAEFRKTLGS